MAEEFQSGICGGNWWIPPSKGVFMGGSSTHCSPGIFNGCDLPGTYESSVPSISWMTDFVDLKTRSSTSSCKDSSNTNNNNSMGSHDSDHSNSMVFQNSQRPQQTDSDSTGVSSFMDNSAMQIMGFGLSSPSPSSDWNQDLLGRGESYNSMMEEKQMNTSGGGKPSHSQKDWNNPTNLNTTTPEDPLTNMNGLKPLTNDQGFLLLDHNQRQQIPVTSYANYPSTLFQSLLETQHQQALPSNRSSMNYSSAPNYATNLIQSPGVSKQQQLGSLNLNNNTPYWNTSTAAAALTPSSFSPSPQPQFILPSLEDKHSCIKLPTKVNNEEMKKGSEPALKRPRFETPSPLPAFKVRKEKLGDRITALQQLVSPFGKTDTASVLHEAIDYIKFLHDQVSVLINPYMKNGNQIQHQQAASDHKLKEQEGERKQDLRSKGLCLVPISSTFPVANETITADFRTPTIGGAFR